MSIIGFNFHSISAHANESGMDGTINVTSTPTIESVEKKDLATLGVKEAIGVKFKFVTSYEKAGEISFTGEVFYRVEDAKKTEKMWKDGKKLDDGVAIDILNTIIKRCVSRAVELSDTLRLPPPVQFPIVKKEDKTDKAAV